MIILDTHVWVWFVSNPELISPRARKILDTAVRDKQIIISSISAWEVALLVAKKRLELSMEVADWIAKSERMPFINFVPVDNQVAVKSVNLPASLHNDPADRMIIATAILAGIPLITKDIKLLEYPHVKTIW